MVEWICWGSERVGQVLFNKVGLGGRVVKLRLGSDYYYFFTGVVFTTVKALLLFLFRAIWLRSHPFYFYLGVANAACCCCSGD